MLVKELFETGTTRGSLDNTSSRSNQTPGVAKDAQGNAFCEGPAYDKLPHNFATLLPCPHSLSQVEHIISLSNDKNMTEVTEVFVAYRTAVWG
jgi:hypothetical protein